MRGRPTKLTTALSKAITDAIRLGLPLSIAGDRAGVGISTVNQWMARGEGKDKRPARLIYVEFADAVKKARAEDMARRIARIEQAARGGAVAGRKTVTVTKPDGTVTTTATESYTEPQWTADAWHLERSDPNNWGRRDRHEHTGKDGGPLKVELTEIVVRNREEASRLLPLIEETRNGHNGNGKA